MMKNHRLTSARKDGTIVLKGCDYKEYKDNEKIVLAIALLAEYERQTENGELVGKELHDKEVQQSYEKGYKDAIVVVYNILENKFGGEK